jgi:hypothetical protein
MQVGLGGDLFNGMQSFPKLFVAVTGIGEARPDHLHRPVFYKMLSEKVNPASSTRHQH